MQKLEQSVEMLHKMYEARKTAKWFLKEEYPVKIKTFIQIVKGCMEVNKCDEVHAILKACEDPKIKDNELARAMVVSAALEISEGNIKF